MSHDAAPEDVHHRHPLLHHPNHRHAVPSRPILLRRATTSHLGRQSPGRPQGALPLPCRRFPATHLTQIHQPVFACPCGEILIPRGGAMIDMPVLSQRFLKPESGYGNLSVRMKVTRIRMHATLAPAASGSAQSTRKIQSILILGTRPPFYRSHVTFQGPPIPKNNKIYIRQAPPNLNYNDYLHRATPNLLPPPKSH